MSAHCLFLHRPFYIVIIVFGFKAKLIFIGIHSKDLYEILSHTGSFIKYTHKYMYISEVMLGFRKILHT